MASPSNMSPWPGVTEPIPFPGPDPAASQTHHNITDSELILTRLREQIAAGRQDTDLLLGTIAIAAQAMTDATGSALGMRRDGTVACVGRSGETAPALGARLSESSGISGECLRNGRIQRCDDSETDPRVDAEVCRHLGLRSIAAVPIRSRLETVGILEVFSTTPRAFTDEHLAHLSSLADLADIASSGARPDTQVESAGAVTPIPRDLPILTSQWAHSETPRKPVWRYFALAGGVLLLGLFSFASWRMWNELKSRNASKPITVQATPAAPTNAQSQLPTESNLVPKPTPEQIASTGNATKSTGKNRVVQAANIESEPDDGLIRAIPSDSPVQVKTNTPVTTNQPAENDALASNPPQVAMVTTPSDTLHGILSGQTSLPKLSPTPVSGGATPLVLERKVMPTYPLNARTLRLQGAVVMRAIVTEKGDVSQVKQISGDPILGRAAKTAIEQWHYRPAILNGKPTPSETDITLNFKLP